MPVQIIGFDPDTDFSIQPWIRESYSGSIGDGDVIVGSGITIPQNNSMQFYDTECRVVAHLEETGTGLDNAVYTNMNTIKEMMTNAENLGFHYFDDVNADHTISTVMVKVRDGYSVEDVANDINIHVRHVEATQAQNMIASIAGGLSNVSRIIGILTIMIWILSIVVLMVAFLMIANERTKEFSVLRVVGASQKMLSRLMRMESMVITSVGAVIGVVAASLVVFPFGHLIRSRLDLPYLLPKAGWGIAMLVASVAIAVLAGWMTSLISARRIGRTETGLILREDA